MRILLFVLLFTFASSNVLGQSVQVAPDSTSQEMANQQSCVIQLKEFRFKKDAKVLENPDEIAKLVDNLKDDSPIEVIQSFTLSGLTGTETTMQIGQTEHIVVGNSFGPNGRESKQISSREVGTMVRLTPVVVSNSFKLTLSIERTRSSDKKEDLPSGFTTFQTKSHLLLKPGVTTLVCGANSESSTYLTVSIK